MKINLLLQLVILPVLNIPRANVQSLTFAKCNHNTEQQTVIKLDFVKLLYKDKYS
jgi:hypothetical protein